MSKVLPQFGPYEALRRLGVGGMAETFLALRRGPQGFVQKVCIKRVLPAYAENADFTDSFLREARTSAALRHANIVQVLDFGLVDDSYYLALELIEGLDLRALLAASEEGQRRTLPAELVTLIAGELAAALEHAHGEGPDREAVVHRDVSPSNVLVSPAGEVKLTDFGIARALGGERLTTTGVIKGKVPYLPPEYIERGQFDQRSDLFSLGVMLFELLAGERPFDGESDLDTIRRIAGGERPRLLELAPHVPQALAECVERLIAVAPAARFDSARALLEALPPVATHVARRELGSLVETRLRAIERISGRISTRLPPPVAAATKPARSVLEDPGEARTLTAPAASIPPAARRTSDTTRTRRPKKAGRRSRPQTGRLIALGLAGMALSALLVGAALKGQPNAARENTKAPAPSVAAASPMAPQSVPVSGEQRALSAPPASQVVPAAPVQSDPSQSAVEAGGSGRDPNKAPRANTPAEVRVVVYPFGDVWVDGKAFGHAPVSLKLASGTHEIGVGDGRPEQRRSVQVHSGQHESLVFRRSVELH